MQDLASASTTVIVGNVTAENTIGVNDSIEFGASVPLVPVTDYNVTVTTVLLDHGYGLKPGFWTIVPQVGGTFGHTTMNVTGYPTLSVGTSYVFFLTGKPSILGIYYDLTTAGAQGLFYIQGGNVYSLDNMYPQADSWLPVKANGVPLAQFVQQIQPAVASSTTVTQTSSQLTTTTISPCTAPGVSCGDYFIASARLVAQPQNNGSAILYVTIDNNGTGRSDTTAISYFINGTGIGSTPGVPTGKTVSFSLPVPSSSGITPGKAYNILARTDIDRSGTFDRRITVTALPASTLSSEIASYGITMAAATIVIVFALIALFWRRSRRQKAVDMSVKSHNPTREPL